MKMTTGLTSTVLLFGPLSLSLLFFLTGCEQPGSPLDAPDQTAISPSTPSEHPEAGSQLVADRLTNINQEDPQPETVVAPSQFTREGSIVRIEDNAITLKTETLGDGNEETEDIGEVVFALAQNTVVYVKGDESGEVLAVSDLRPGQQVTLIMERQEDPQDGVLSVVRKIQLPPVTADSATPSVQDGT